MPNTAVGSGSPSSTAPWATTARCTVGHDTECAAATSDWSRPSSTAHATPGRPARERLQWTDRSRSDTATPVCATATTPTVANREIARAGQRPLLRRGRHHPTPGHRAASGVIGDQLHDPDPQPGKHDTLHRQPTRPVPTDTTHHRYGQPRRVALLSLLQNTARIKESRAALVQARRTRPTSGCPLKIEEPRNHRRPDLPRPCCPRAQQPTPAYPRLPNPNRSPHRPSDQLDCFHWLRPLSAEA